MVAAATRLARRPTRTTARKGRVQGDCRACRPDAITPPGGDRETARGLRWRCRSYRTRVTVRSRHGSWSSHTVTMTRTDQGLRPDGAVPPTTSGGLTMIQVGLEIGDHGHASGRVRRY